MDLSYAGFALFPIVTGLIELAKGQGFPSKRAPILALGLSLAAAFTYVSPDWRIATLAGLGMALAAVGLYEATVRPAARSK
jgi:type II secretory pathway component PulM